MNTLKMVAYRFTGELYGSSKLKDEIPYEELDHNGWWYLHGDLEDMVGYDKALTVNCKSAGYSVDSINWTEIRGNIVVSVQDPLIRPEIHINGIIPVEIEGIDKPCVGYFWTKDKRPVCWEGKEYPHWEQRGLVCLKDDIEACEYAEEMYNKKSEII